MNSLILRLSGLLLLAFFATACEMPPAPTPNPVTPNPVTPSPATPTPVAIVTPTTTVPDGPTELQSLAHGYRLTLSPAWQILYWAEDADPPLLDSVTDSFESAQATLEFGQQFEQGVDPFIDLVAQNVGDESGAKLSLTITTVPRDGLSLQDYLAAASAQIEQIDGTTVTLVGFDDTLRVDRLPTGKLIFERGDVIYQQLALFNNAADEIILLSFAGDVSTTNDSIEREIVEIMRTFLVE